MKKQSVDMRLAGYSEALTAISDSPIVGFGPGGVVSSTGHVIHNTILYSMASFGIPFGLLFIFIII